MMSMLDVRAFALRAVRGDTSSPHMRNYIPVTSGIWLTTLGAVLLDGELIPGTSGDWIYNWTAAIICIIMALGLLISKQKFTRLGLLLSGGLWAGISSVYLVFEEGDNTTRYSVGLGLASLGICVIALGTWWISRRDPDVEDE